MHNFYVDRDQIKDDLVFIRGQDVQHIKKVLRLGPKDIIYVRDNSGLRYEVCIESINKHEVKGKILEGKKVDVEPKVKVTLYQGIPKGSKMDTIVQKWVELGGHSIVPVVCQRTVVRLQSEHDWEKKRKRWYRISEEASKQCGRGIIPRVDSPCNFARALDLAKGNQLNILPWELEKHRSIKALIDDIDKDINTIGVFVGPEGGFDSSEIQLAIEKGLSPITLGPRILRTETVGLCLLSIIMFQWGQLGG
ncbi:MAG TPA: 16S rRNA (uracil(1498)-N(3))-methyltransferase [Clostridiales bacterium]|jgi:16S rRNA (uracil1498-N3)-methyltransferase|nr:16S rRNA (uracil(1498)-N(3))-methyltransferase [Clostridiales bacterium]